MSKDNNFLLAKNMHAIVVISEKLHTIDTDNQTDVKSIISMLLLSLIHI